MNKFVGRDSDRPLNLEENTEDINSFADKLLSANKTTTKKGSGSSALISLLCSWLCLINLLGSPTRVNKKNGLWFDIILIE